MTDANKTRRDQVAEAGASTQYPFVALAALRSSGHIFNLEQQQRLVDTIANDPRRQFVELALSDIQQLTEGQRAQLERALSPSP